MARRITLMVLLIFCAAARTQAGEYMGFDPRYTPRTGDLNGDGRQDVYLDYNPKVIPVMMDDLVIPVPLRETLSDFVLLQNANGEFTKAPVSSSQRNILKQWLKQEAIELLYGDYNSDGILDVIIKKIASAIPGVRDVIAFGPDNKGDLPSFIRNADGTFMSFIKDVAGWNEDPENYYDAGWYWTCVPGYAWVQVVHWTAEGYPYYTVELMYVDVCGWAFNPTNYSIPAIQYLNAMFQPTEDGSIEAGSTNAQVIADILQNILGVPFGRGILNSQQPGAPPGPRPYVPEACQNPGSTEDFQFCATHLLMRLLTKIGREVVAEGFDCFDDFGFDQSHHYELQNAVCTVGAPRCTVAEVYQNESLVHPVVGYWDQMQPIYNVAQGRWNPPAPLGFAAMNCTTDVPEACDKLGMFEGGPIMFTVDPSVYWHRNDTLPGHVFHPGSINRSVFQSGNQVKIYTIGEGRGNCPRTNEKSGTQIFITLDSFIKCHLAGKCHRTHPVGP